MEKWRSRVLWFTLGMAFGVALTAWNAVRLGYVPWNSAY